MNPESKQRDDRDRGIKKGETYSTPWIVVDARLFPTADGLWGADNLYVDLAKKLQANSLNTSCNKCSFAI